MLCTACQNIFRGQLILNDGERREYKDHHLTAQSFAQAVSQNCYICTSLQEHYRTDHNRSTLGPLQLAEVLRDTGTQYSLDIKHEFSSVKLYVYAHERDLDGMTLWYDNPEWRPSCN